MTRIPAECLPQVGRGAGGQACGSAPCAAAALDLGVRNQDKGRSPRPWWPGWASAVPEGQRAPSSSPSPLVTVPLEGKGGAAPFPPSWPCCPTERPCAPWGADLTQPDHLLRAPIRHPSTLPGQGLPGPLWVEKSRSGKGDSSAETRSFARSLSCGAVASAGRTGRSGDIPYLLGQQ